MRWDSLVVSDGAGQARVQDRIKGQVLAEIAHPAGLATCGHGQHVILDDVLIPARCESHCYKGRTLIRKQCAR